MSARGCSWKVALPTGLFLATVAAAAVWWRFEPQYEAKAVLEFHDRPQVIACFGVKDAAVSKGYFHTQMEIIRSRRILGRALASDKIKQLPEIRIQPDPIEYLNKQVKVVRANGSDSLEIKYSGPDPENAALVVNEVTKQYLTAQDEEEFKSTRNIIAALTREMESREKDIGALRHQVQVAAQQVSSQEPELARARPEVHVKEPAAGITEPVDQCPGRSRDAYGADQGERRGTAPGGGSEYR